MRHLALYGNVTIERDICPRCQSQSLILAGEFQCCGRKIEQVQVIKSKRESNPPLKRKLPSKLQRLKILEVQENCCFWCNKRFDSHIIYHCKRQRVSLCWDHVIPYCFDQNSEPINFVASCKFCNAWKSAKIFRDIEEVRIYVNERWKKEETFATETLFELQEPISAKKKMARILQH